MIRETLFEFPTAARRDPAVEAWFDARPRELGAIARSWFDVMRACGDDVRELLHDFHPTACVDEAAFGYVNVFTAHVNVGFFQGTELADPDGLLEGTGKFMRHVKLKPDRNVDAAGLKRLIETAYLDIRRRLGKAEAMANKPAILVLTGASGAGKTALITKLNEFAIPGVEGINCDRVNIPETADPSDRQAEILRYWITKFSKEKTKLQLAVLDTQIRPHLAREVLDQAGVMRSQIVLVDCDPDVRNERLRDERKQPELANPRMDCWAAYLRGQADALGLPIIETSNASLDESVKTLEVIFNKLLELAKAV
jgi:hypothetical protein